MEAVLSAASVRVFARSIKLLAKIGDTLSVESSDDRLSFRALAASQSGFGRFTFLRGFFDSFNHQTSQRISLSNSQHIPNQSGTQSRKNNEIDGSQSHSRVKRQRIAEHQGDQSVEEEEEWRINNHVEVDGGDVDSLDDDQSISQSLNQSINPSNDRSEYAFKVKVNAKALLLCFRSGLSSVTSMTLKLTDSENEGFTAIERVMRGVPNAKVSQSISSENDKGVGALIVTLYSGHKGVFRTFRVNFLEEIGPVLEPNFRRSQCSSSMRTDAKKFADWIDTFQQDVDEISITCGTQDVRLKSFIDWQVAAQSMMERKAGNENAPEGRKAAKIRSAIVTDYSVPSIDFMPYNISDLCLNNALIFTFPELRLFVSVCESCDEPVWIFAQSPGQPILITNTERSANRKRSSHDAANDSVIDDDSMVSTSHSRSHASSAGDSGEDPLSATWSGEIILATLAPAVYQSIMANGSTDSVPASAPIPASQSPRPVANIVDAEGPVDNGSEGSQYALNDDLMADY